MRLAAKELNQMKLLTAVDLFCGAGGLSAGLGVAGFQVIGALDSWKPAVSTYQRNFSHPVIFGDIRTTTTSEFLSRIGHSGTDIDLVAGGPPCQGFSVQRIGSDDDKRNDLLFEFARFVCDIKPRMFLMENVPGLLGKRGAAFARRFESIVSEHGYVVENARINTAEYGLPQIRKRIFYYGWLRSRVPRFGFPSPTHSEAQFRTVMDAIGSLPRPHLTKEAAAVSDPLHWQMRMSGLNMERLRLIPPGGGFEDLPVSMRVNCHKNGADKIGHRFVYGRLSPDRPASTITGRFDSFTRGKFAHPSEHRNITLREGARLQSFPDEFAFTGTQEDITALIGNAIPPLVASVIGAAIHQHLSNVSRDTVKMLEIERRDQYGLFEAHAD